jgi:hypothetical protein
MLDPLSLGANVNRYGAVLESLSHAGKREESIREP